MAVSTSHSLPYPIKNARFSLEIAFRTSAGTPTDPTTPDTEFSTDGGATFSDCAEEITTGGTNGIGYITLTGAETNANMVALACKSANCVTTPVFLYPRVLPIASTGTLSAGSAGGGTLGTILAYDIAGCFVMTTGGTGGGGTGGANNQIRKVATYTQSTGAFTVIPNWETTPDATTTYAVHLPSESTFAALKALNAATPGRTVVVDTAGLVDANTVKVGPTGSGTAQTARDIGLSVLLSNGTSTGQIVLNSGVADVRLADAVSHGGTLGSSTATFALSRLNITSQTSNTAGVTIAGNGSGAGMSTTGGLTGIGFLIVGGGTSGDGLKLTTTSGHGINSAPVGTSKHGIFATGGNGGTSDGVSLIAGTGGVGVRAGSLTITGATIHTGNFLLSDGLTIAAPSTVDRPGMKITGNGAGEAILAIGGASAAGVTFNGAIAALNCQGTGGGSGILAYGGPSSGSGMIISATSGNADGLSIGGIGTGNGISILAGVTDANGIYIESSGTAAGVEISQPSTGDGIYIHVTDGTALSLSSATGQALIAGTGATNAVTINGAFIATNASNDIRGVTLKNGTITTSTFAAGAINAAAIAANAITAAKIATDAIGAAQLAADAVTEIQSGLSTLTAAGVRTAVGLASANLDTQLAAVQADTDNIQTRIPAALVSGRMDSSVGAMAANVLTASALATDAVTEISDAVRAGIIVDHGSGSYVNSGAGSGAFVVTVTVKDGSAVALQNVLVRLKEGINSFTATTNASGIATFDINAATYVESMTKDGYTFTPTSIVVTTDANFNAVMTLIVAPTPSAPEKATVTGTLLNGDGSVAANVTGKMTLHAGKNDERPLLSGGNGLTTTVIPFRTNASGVIKADDGTSTLEANRTDYPYMTQADGTEGQPYWQFECDALNVKGRKVSVTTANLDISDLAS